MWTEEESQYKMLRAVQSSSQGTLSAEELRGDTVGWGYQGRLIKLADQSDNRKVEGCVKGQKEEHSYCGVVKLCKELGDCEIINQLRG